MGRNNNTICSFCINLIPSKEIYSVSVKMYNDEKEEGIYYTPCCKKCLKNENILNIIKEAKE